MKAKFKVGERVKIVKRIIPFEDFIWIYPDMNNSIGKHATIKQVRYNKVNFYYVYSIDLDCWNYPEESLISIDKLKIDILLNKYL